MTDTLSETDGDENSPHNHPIRVYESSGDTYAVAVETKFADGSKRTEHYTEEQARAIFEGLDVLLNDPSEVGAAADSADGDEGGARYVVRHDGGSLTGPYTEYVRAAQVDSSNDHHGVLKIDEVGGVDDPVPDGEAVETVID